MSVSEACALERSFNKSRTATEIYSFLREAIQEGQVYRYQMVRVVVLVQIHRREFVLRRMENLFVFDLLGQRVDRDPRNLLPFERFRVRGANGFEVDAAEWSLEHVRYADEYRQQALVGTMRPDLRMRKAERVEVDHRVSHGRLLRRHLFRVER